MLQLNNITLRRGASVLLQQASLRLDINYKAGLIGRNGAGKTSLMKLLMGELHEDHGTVAIPKSWKIAHLAQELPTTDLTAFDYVRSGDTAWTKLQLSITKAEADNDGLKLAELYGEMEVIDGYRIDSRVAIILKGLGFAEDAFQQPVSSFSGGWQMRLQLARVLLSSSDILLLDEPTNHLDLETIMWLETWLQSYQGMLIVISHDRDFLDQATSHTISISHQRLKLYQGNYSSFARQFQEALLLQDKSNQKIIKQQQHLQSFVDRFRAKATKAKQAQSRMKAIQKLQTSSDLQEDEGVSFQFFESPPAGYPAISIRADLGYDKTIILHNAQLNVGGGDRIGVIGMNGSGKSTLLKSIAYKLAPVKGDIAHHPKTKIGYFSQKQVDMLHLNETPLAHLLQQDTKVSEGRARTYLGGFGFSNEKVLSQVSLFSGGEKARLALALLIWDKPNVLVLDEPTNHLDMHVREALTLALQDFSGAVLLVSHDRYFIECCASTLWLVRNGTVKQYDGDLSDYQALCQIKPATKKTAKKQAASQATHDKQTIKQLNLLERDINKLQQQLKTLDEKLADPELYQQDNKANLDKLVQRQQELQKLLDDKEQQWMQLSE